MRISLAFSKLTNLSVLRGQLSHDIRDKVGNSQCTIFQTDLTYDSPSPHQIGVYFFRWLDITSHLHCHIAWSMWLACELPETIWTIRRGFSISTWSGSQTWPYYRARPTCFLYDLQIATGRNWIKIHKSCCQPWPNFPTARIVRSEYWAEWKGRLAAATLEAGGHRLQSQRQDPNFSTSPQLLKTPTLSLSMELTQTG